MNILVKHISIAFLLSLLVISQVQAIPAFARKEGMQCSSCHSAFPALNQLGRMYKMEGYRFSKEQMPERMITDNLMLDKLFPVSAGIKSRPYDRKDSGETKNRAIHELELMVAGHIGNGFSGFLEMEAEDEDEFNTSTGVVQATYSKNPGLNIQVSRAPILFFDPYNSYSDKRRVTIGHTALLDQSFGGADNDKGLRTIRQNVTVFGQPLAGLFYGVSYSGLADDPEGVDADTYSGRLAYQITPNIMIGGLAISGTCTVNSQVSTCGTTDRDYSRTGIDTEMTFFNQQLTLNGAFLKADDDLANGGPEVSNDSYYVQTFYNFMHEGRPLVSPVIRYDAYEINDGQDEVTAWTVAASHYFTENIKMRLEYWDRKGDGSATGTMVNDDDRLTLQIDAFF